MELRLISSGKCLSWGRGRALPQRVFVTQVAGQKVGNCWIGTSVVVVGTHMHVLFTFGLLRNQADIVGFTKDSRWAFYLWAGKVA